MGSFGHNVTKAPHTHPIKLGSFRGDAPLAGTTVLHHREDSLLVSLVLDKPLPKRGVPVATLVVVNHTYMMI